MKTDDSMLWSGQPVKGGRGGGGGGRKKKKLRGRTSHGNSCGEQSANLEHQTLFLDFAGFGGASM